MKTLEQDTLVEHAPVPVTANGHADKQTLPNGEAVAAFLAAGIGCFVMGLITTLSEMYTSFANQLNWNNGVGPLSGKTIVTVAIWLIAWAVLYVVYRGKQANLARAFTVTLGLVAVGVLGTFPIFFDMLK